MLFCQTTCMPLIGVEKLQNSVFEKDEDLTQMLLEKEEHEKSDYTH